MSTWILKADPRVFDLDAYLATDPVSLRLPVKQWAAEARAGDRAFVWRGEGVGEAKRVGVVADAIVQTPSTVREIDVESLRFRRDAPSSPETVLELRLERVELKHRLQRGWLANDPVLTPSVVHRIELATATLLDDAQAARITALWRRARAGWTYAEVVAGLWAFQRTLGGQVSRREDAPVVVAAMRTGRVVQGMYNKVQHFRAMDPNDPRRGLSSNSNADRAVWSRFFDPVTGRLRGDEVEAEFERLWPDAAAEPIPPQPGFPIGTADLAGLDLPALLARYSKGRDGRPTRPRTRRVAETVFDRDPLIVAIARVRAADRCELADCGHPTFMTTDGRRYVEVHHIEPLAEGGEDTPENVACLCPSHHREAHRGASAATIRSSLQQLREPSPEAAVASPTIALPIVSEPHSGGA